MELWCSFLEVGGTAQGTAATIVVVGEVPPRSTALPLRGGGTGNRGAGTRSVMGDDVCHEDATEARAPGPAAQPILAIGDMMRGGDNRSGVAALDTCIGVKLVAAGGAALDRSSGPLVAVEDDEVAGRSEVVGDAPMAGAS